MWDDDGLNVKMRDTCSLWKGSYKIARCLRKKFLFSGLDFE